MQPVGSRIILDELEQVSRALWSVTRSTYTARVPPTAAFILDTPGRLPHPRPLEAHGWAAAGRIIAHQSNVGVFVKVRVGMELASHEVLDLFRR